MVVEHPLRFGLVQGVLHEVGGGEDAGEDDAGEGQDPLEDPLVVDHQVVVVD